jgi:hypothetical protein
MACQYPENKKDFLGYDQALREGWPIASGIIEGTARHLIADRLEITGSQWSVGGAEESSSSARHPHTALGTRRSCCWCRASAVCGP